MNCEECEASLIDHAYDELAAEPRRAVTRHLAECAGCAVAYCRLRADLDGALQAAHEAPPPAVRQRLRAEVERAFRPSWWRRGLALVRRPVPAYAVVAALAIPAALWLVRTSAGEEAAGAVTSPRVRGYDAAAPPRIQRPVL
jgi:anti-sigma factor RsiW